MVGYSRFSPPYGKAGGRTPPKQKQNNSCHSPEGEVAGALTQSGEDQDDLWESNMIEAARDSDHGSLGRSAVNWASALCLIFYRMMFFLRLSSSQMAFPVTSPRYSSGSRGSQVQIHLKTRQAPEHSVLPSVPHILAGQWLGLPPLCSMQLSPWSHNPEKPPLLIRNVNLASHKSAP